MSDPKNYHYHKDIMSGKVAVLHARSIRRALADHGPEVTKALKKLVSTGPRTGRMYTYRGRKYRASAPGEPPAKRSGRLSRSFVSIPRTMELVIGNTAFSKDGAPYPLFLEDGTIKMARRPYFMKTIESLHMRLEQELQNTGAI